MWWPQLIVLRFSSWPLSPICSNFAQTLLNDCFYAANFFQVFRLKVKVIFKKEFVETIFSLSTSYFSLDLTTCRYWVLNDLKSSFYVKAYQIYICKIIVQILFFSLGPVCLVLNTAIACLKKDEKRTWNPFHKDFFRCIII